MAGEPGCVVAFEHGKALVDWPDLDMGRPTKHSLDSLVIDESYHARMTLPELADIAA